MKRNVFSVAPGAPFLSTVVEALLAGDVVSSFTLKGDPLSLARATLYVPTQRAGRALRAEFARRLSDPAVFLPRILPLGALDAYEDAALFNDFSDDFDARFPPAIDEIERRLALSKLVLKWAKALKGAIVSTDLAGAPVVDDREAPLIAPTAASAYRLSRELCALIDEFIIEDVDASKLATLVSQEHDRFFAITTHFLQIALQQWPQHLQERGAIDHASRQKLLLEAQIARLSSNASDAPVIAIGSTGANPATARLLDAISRLPQGAVILPGLDLDLDDDAFMRVGAASDDASEPAFTHPQAVLKHLLEEMKLRREDVTPLGEPTPALAARRRFLSQALRPADTTHEWRAYREANAAAIGEALAGVAYVEAPDERREALTLALFMRQVLETQGKTAALIAPNRALARRVANELERFGVAIDDSGGEPLAATPLGELARLLFAIALEGATAVHVAALLNHPLVCLGMTRERVCDLAPLAEIAVLRSTPRAQEGWLASVAAARSAAASDPHAAPFLRRMSEADWVAVSDLFSRLDAACASLAALPANATLTRRVREHERALQALCEIEGEPLAAFGAEELFDLFASLTQADAGVIFDAENYASLFEQLAFEATLRGARRTHPRLKILGRLEARLLDVDLMLLAGLDEMVWPPATEAGAFLNRSMRAALGLSAPERRIGQSAHDFLMAFGAREVVVSRAQKRGDSPTVASRFISRVKALAGSAFDACKARGDAMLEVAEALDRPAVVAACERPNPTPPLELRPQQLSVTRIETLRRDPYSIYAERILRLAPLAPLGAPADRRHIGTALHEVIAQFTLAHSGASLPPDAEAELLSQAREKLAPMFSDPSFAVFSWPRLEQGLRDVVAFERARRSEKTSIFVETRGTWTFPLADGSSFTLAAVADRIEISATNEAYIFDYKTGTPPTEKQVASGLSPQLTLEAAMISNGAFDGLPKASARGVAYVSARGDGAEPMWRAQKGDGLSSVVEEHKAQLFNLLNQLRRADRGFPSRPFVQFASRFGDYDHLARVKEWSRGGEGEDS